MENLVIGIDPGEVSGAVVVVDKNLRVLRMMPMPITEVFADLIEEYKDTLCHVFCERAQSFPGQSAVGTFNYARHYGELLGVLKSFSVRHTLVPPQTWTKHMHVGSHTYSDPKRRSLEVCRRLYPGIDLRGSERSLKEHSGIVDALLIAAYGIRVLSGSTLVGK